MAQGDINITIAGNLTGDPELRFTPSGQAVTNFTVATTTRVLNKQTNEWEDGDTTFIRCSVWRQYAENVAESLLKGQRVIVTGRLKVRQYEAKDGSKGTSIECDVEEVGPALKYATAVVTRVPSGHQQASQRQPARNSGGDPWGGSGGAGGFPDEPPF